MTCALPMLAMVLAQPPGAFESVATVSDCRAPAIPDPGSIDLARDLVYARPGDGPLRLDVARPRRPGPHPVALLVHGGAWQAGSKEVYREEIQALAGLGYAAVAVGYRLVRQGKNPFPAAVADVRCAARWLRAHAKDHAIDPERAVALGYSAGAHLAAMLGTASDVAGLDGDCPLRDPPLRIRGVVALAGPFDLRPGRDALAPVHARLVTNFLGVSPAADPAHATLASPLAHVSPGDARMLLVHDPGDDSVPFSQSVAMVAALRRAGVPASLLRVEGPGHGLELLGSRGPLRTVTCTVLAFMDAATQP